MKKDLFFFHPNKCEVTYTDELLLKKLLKDVFLEEDLKIKRNDNISKKVWYVRIKGQEKCETTKLIA